MTLSLLAGNSILRLFLLWDNSKIKTGFRWERIEQEMNSKKLTAQCAVLQGSYWVAVCAINGFATVFLLHIGLKSSQIGVVLALGNILGVILQPFVAAAADRAKRVTLQ